MHIAAGHLNPHTLQNTTSASVLAARRAEETRRKLATASAELDAVSTTESAWMIDAWGGGSSGGHAGQHPAQQPAEDAGENPAAASGQTTDRSAVQAGFQSSAQLVSQMAVDGSRPLLAGGQPSPAAEEIRRTPATGPVSFWA